MNCCLQGSGGDDQGTKAKAKAKAHACGSEKIFGRNPARGARRGEASEASSVSHEPVSVSSFDIAFLHTIFFFLWVLFLCSTQPYSLECPHHWFVHGGVRTNERARLEDVIRSNSEDPEIKNKK